MDRCHSLSNVFRVHLFRVDLLVQHAYTAFEGALFHVGLAESRSGLACGCLQPG